MSIQIIKPGILDTLHDMGRHGYSHLGINPGGAMDLYAMEVANSLVGNPKNCTVLEMHFPAPVIRFNSTAIIALSGADFSATINHVPTPINKPVIVGKNSVISFTKSITGARCYLAIIGGFNCEAWLGSTSTNLVVGKGGFKGRVLKKNDEVLFNSNPQIDNLITENEVKKLSWSANMQSVYGDDTIHFIPGEAYDELKEKDKKQFQEKFFNLSSNSSRMAYYTEGVTLDASKLEERISSAVTRGTMQLLPNGQLIILMADHQTTGGYPVVGTVSSDSLHVLAQKKAGEKISFAISTMENAEQKMIAQQRDLLQLQNACNFRWQQFWQ